jgi:SAM-dependent methyltransferase
VTRADEKTEALTPAAPREVQVAPEHYDFERYDDLERWCSYWYQIRAAMRLRPKRVLEIGSGTGVFKSYLNNAGVQCQSLDIDASRKPDYIADLTDLDRTLPTEARFDIVAAFQVLEHLPFEHFEDCLAGIARRAPYALISLPYRGQRVRWSFWWGDYHFTLGHKFMMPWTMKRCPEDPRQVLRGRRAPLRPREPVPLLLGAEVPDAAGRAAGAHAVIRPCDPDRRRGARASLRQFLPACVD